MAAPYKAYLQSIHKKFKYFGTWLPGSSVRLGDVGIFEGKTFRHITSLENLGIPFRIRKDDTPSPFSHSSGSDVNIAFKAAGETSDIAPNIPKASAGVVLELGREGAFVFQIHKGLEDTIDDKAELQKDIIAAYQDGKWDKSWVVIDQLVRAESFTMALAMSANARLELSAAADVKAASINLANAEAGLAISHKSGQVTEVIAEAGTPLFKAMKLKFKFFRPDPLLEPLGAPLENVLTPFSLREDPAKKLLLRVEELDFDDLD